MERIVLRVVERIVLKVAERTVLTVAERTVLRVEERTVLKVAERIVLRVEERIVLRVEERTVLKVAEPIALKVEERIALRVEPSPPSQLEAEQKVSEAGMSRAAAEAAAAAGQTVMLSEEDPVDSTDQALAPQAVVARQAWDPGAEEAVAVDGADKPSQPTISTLGQSIRRTA